MMSERSTQAAPWVSGPLTFTTTSRLVRFLVKPYLYQLFLTDSQDESTKMQHHPFHLAYYKDDSSYKHNEGQGQYAVESRRHFMFKVSLLCVQFILSFADVHFFFHFICVRGSAYQLSTSSQSIIYPIYQSVHTRTIAYMRTSHSDLKLYALLIFFENIKSI